MRPNDKMTKLNPRGPLYPEATSEESERTEKFEDFLLKDYDDRGETGKDDLAPSPSKDLDKYERRERFKRSVDDLTDDQFDKLEGLVGRSTLSVAFGHVSDDTVPTSNLPQKAPALWEARTSGREVSPADFIQKYYSQWFECGLTRAHIGQLDDKLYAAYARQISRSPDKAIAELPSEPRQKRNDPEEALERIRAQTRASVARRRDAM